MKFNEQATIENYIIDFLKKNLGYKYVKPAEFAKLRSFENEYVIDSYLANAIAKINDISDNDVIQTVLREVKKIDTNKGFLEVIRNGINIKDPETGQFRDVKLFDFADATHNHFVVTNQFRFQDDDEAIRTDVLVFVNGLPLVNIEAKSPTASQSVSYEDAIDQIARYQKQAKKMFLPNCFNIATDGIETVYGATGAPKRFWLKWRDDELEAKYTDGGQVNELAVTLEALLSPEKLLDIVENFILFEQTKDGLVKKMARYQQMRAANKIVARVKAGDHKKGLVWHTQGSGKTLTMFFTAWKLRFDPDLANPKIFILVDRIDLDDQVFDEFMNHGGKNIIRVTSRKDLEEKISSSERGIFISTIQKFTELGDTISNMDENIIVLSDEAHRGDEGKSGINLRNAMGRAFYFGFTGTPVDNLRLNTHRNYGPDGERYLDYYSIKQAIDDGATVPVTYQARLSKFMIDEDDIDAQFDELTAGLDDEMRTEIAKRYGKKEAMIKLPQRMQAVAQDIVEHFKVYIEPEGFKAQVVCYDRESTAMYKKILDTIIPPEWSAVVYSAGDRNSDSDELRAYTTNKSERDQIIVNFKNTDHPLRFLLVCDMLLTGFDAPIEQVMYLDKPLRDHNLLQAIARTNRVYPDKKFGLVIDYYGITRNLERALSFDESEVADALVNIDVMKARFVEVLHEVMELFPGINTENPSNDNLRNALKIFYENEDKQRYFTQKYGQLKSLYEFLAPDPFLKEYLRSFEWVTSFYLAFMKEFRSVKDRHLLEQYGEKMKELVRQSVDFEGITKSFRDLDIGEMYTLHRIDDMDEDEQAQKLEKMLRQEIAEHVESNPKFEKFSERLRRIRDEFEQHQIDLAERIKRYKELTDDIKKAHAEARDHGFDLKQYGLFVIAQEFMQADDEQLRDFILDFSHRLDDILDVGWQESSKREFFIKEAKRLLLEMIKKEYADSIKVTDFSTLMNRMTDIVIKRF